MDDGDYPVTFLAAAVPAGDVRQHRWDDDQRLLDDLGGAIRQAAPPDETRVLVFGLVRLRCDTRAGRLFTAWVRL